MKNTLRKNVCIILFLINILIVTSINVFLEKTL